MTTFEHAMLGVDGVLATGLHRRYGWKLPVMAGVLANSPDWDGLTLLLGPTAFEKAHRVWGHNFVVCAAVAIMLCSVDYAFDPWTRLSRRVLRRRRPEKAATLIPRQVFSGREFTIWLVVALAAAFSHLAADLVVSGTASLGDWKLPLLWPFSDRAWIFPMVRWGDAGMTIVFALGMLAMARWPHRIQRIAILTLAGVCLYIGIRGALRSTMGI